jgi:hypothetical protein
METSTKRNLGLNGVIRAAAMALAVATAFGGLAATTAQAEDWHRDHGRHDHRYRGGYVYEQPGYYVAPPPVVYYRPPPPSPVIDFVFPLHIR